MFPQHLWDIFEKDRSGDFSKMLYDQKINFMKTNLCEH